MRYLLVLMFIFGLAESQGSCVEVSITFKWRYDYYVVGLTAKLVVCGSNGIEYPSPCAFRSAKEKDPSLQLVACE
jgi:hypothetical protein